MVIAGENRIKILLFPDNKYNYISDNITYNMTSTIDRSDAAIVRVGAVLQDITKPLAERFRALFTLKNVGGSVAVESICRCFGDKSALLKHECAYCLGQMSNHPVATKVLKDLLRDKKVDIIVRHEAAEALAALGSQDARSLLEKYCNDSAVEVSFISM